MGYTVCDAQDCPGTNRSCFSNLLSYGACHPFSSPCCVVAETSESRQVPPSAQRRLAVHPDRSTGPSSCATIRNLGRPLHFGFECCAHYAGSAGANGRDGISLFGRNHVGLALGEL